MVRPSERDPTVPREQPEHLPGSYPPEEGPEKLPPVTDTANPPPDNPPPTNPVDPGPGELRQINKAPTAREGVPG